MIFYLILLIVLLVIIFTVLSFNFSSLMLFSHRQPIVRTPKEYDMDYENVEFKSSDGLNLKGWVIHGKSDKIVIMSHPWLFNRHGFSFVYQGAIRYLIHGQGALKPDVDLLKMAKALNHVGYSLLMFDFRNHGESQKGITGIGLSEYQDIIGALTYVRNRPDLASKKIGFVSICMGANSTIIAMSRMKECFENVKCLVAIQPVSMIVFCRAYLKKAFSFLGLLFIPVVNKLCQWRGGYAIEEESPLEYAEDIAVPTLYVQGQTDPWTELTDINNIYNRTPEPKELWIIPDKMNRFELRNYIGEHPERIIEFLKRYL